MSKIMTLMTVGTGSILADLFDNPPRYASLGTVISDICGSRREPLKIAARKTAVGWEISQINGGINEGVSTVFVEPQKIAGARTLYPYVDQGAAPAFEGQNISTADAVDRFVDEQNFVVGDLVTLVQVGGRVGKVENANVFDTELASIASFEEDQAFFHG